ncbi:hypothetical protein ABIF63_002908 [Bradyrhizobium japonicum]|uniref:DUF3309 domain-containing protein n=14 Tax=Bradyrhizobium TaxID=374 RepID=A0ABV2RPC5_BRAJP
MLTWSCPVVIDPHIVMPPGLAKVPCTLAPFAVFHRGNYRTCGKLPSHHGTGANDPFNKGLEETSMSIGTIILIILVIALLGGFSGIGGGPFYGTGYYGGGGLGLVIVILLILLLLGRI